MATLGRNYSKYTFIFPGKTNGIAGME